MGSTAADVKERDSSPRKRRALRLHMPVSSGFSLSFILFIYLFIHFIKLSSCTTVFYHLSTCASVPLSH